MTVEIFMRSISWREFNISMEETVLTDQGVTNTLKVFPAYWWFVTKERWELHTLLLLDGKLALMIINYTIYF